MKRQSTIIRPSLLNRIDLGPIKRKWFCLIIILSSQFQFGYNQEQVNCFQPTAKTHLDIGKVSTVMLNSGDMWWDLSQGIYEVPKGSGKHSVFNGGLWLGAIDDENNLKVAAQTFRQGGSDFWAGPINNQRLLNGADVGNQIENPNYGTTTEEACSYYDRHFEVNRNGVLNFIAYTNSSDPETEFPNYIIPNSILEYPGNRLYDTSENVFTGEDSIVQTNTY